MTVKILVTDAKVQRGDFGQVETSRGRRGEVADRVSRLPTAILARSRGINFRQKSSFFSLFLAYSLLTFHACYYFGNSATLMRVL